MKTNETTRILHFDEVILNALREDIPWEDVSANAVVPEGVRGRAELIAKANGVLAGLNVFARTFALLDPQAEIVFRKREGEEVRKGELIADVTGDMRAILSGEHGAQLFATHERNCDLYEKSGQTVGGKQDEACRYAEDDPASSFVRKVRGSGGRRRQSPFQSFGRRAVKG